MYATHTQWLACPVCGHAVTIEYGEGGLLEEAILRCGERHRYVVRRGIPRFHTSESLTPSARRMAALHLDSVAGGRHWYGRFTEQVGLTPQQLAGKVVLDFGAGSGRYAEWVARYAAHLVVLDPSGAVEVCRDQLGDLPNVTFVQGALERVPLNPRSYDFVYALGTLQRSKDPRAAFDSAVRLVRPGGELAVSAADSPPRRLSLETAWRRVGRQLPDWLLGEAVDAYVRVAMSLRGGKFERASAALLPLPPSDGARDIDRLRGELFESLNGSHGHLDAGRLLGWCDEAGLEPLYRGAPFSMRLRKPAHRLHAALQPAIGRHSQGHPAQSSVSQLD